MKKLILLISVFTVLFTNVAFANTTFLNPESILKPSDVLLDKGQLRSEDTYYQYGRGEFLASGTVLIVNERNGDIYASIETLAYRNVDRIYHKIFLDMWDVDKEDWEPIDDWTFEVTKEEANNELSIAIDTMTLSGYETNQYYRVRGLHLVEYNGEVESCATQTEGVLITDH